MWFVEWIFLDLMYRKWGKPTKKIQRVLKLDTDGWRRIPDFLGPKKAHELSDGYRWMVILKHDKRLKVESMAWNRKTSFMMAQILSKCFKSGYSAVVSAMSSTTTGFAKVHTTSGKSTLDKGWLDSLNNGCSTLRVTGSFWFETLRPFFFSQSQRLPHKKVVRFVNSCCEIGI